MTSGKRGHRGRTCQSVKNIALIQPLTYCKNQFIYDSLGYMRALLFTCFDVMKNSSTAFTLCSPRPRLTYRQWTGHVWRTYAAMATRLGFSQQLSSIVFSFSIIWSWLLVILPFTFCPRPSKLCTDKFPTKEKKKGCSHYRVCRRVLGCQLLGKFVGRFRAFS